MQEAKQEVTKVISLVQNGGKNHRGLGLKSFLRVKVYLNLRSEILTHEMRY